MGYDESLRSPIFPMHRDSKRQSKTIRICKMNNILANMIAENRIEIWKRLDTNLPDSDSLYIFSTPKLRKLMRVKQESK